jgi:chromosome condensin MukBEF ATPase and DNA-binding subunit MukB
MKIYAPSSQIAWMKKPKPTFKGFPNENKTIISIKKSFCSNLNQSLIEDHSRRDAKMKELESELSTAVQSKNKLEDTVQIIDKYLNELIKENPTLIKLKEALENIIIPLARAQSNSQEQIANLTHQLDSEKCKTENVEVKMKDYETCIHRLQSKIKNQEQTIQNLQKDIGVLRSPPKPKIPKLDLSRLKPKQTAYVPLVKQDQAHYSESEESSNIVPKLDLSLLHGQIQYHDEFMAKADEFSHSWRLQLEKEKRF